MPHFGVVFKQTTTQRDTNANAPPLALNSLMCQARCAMKKQLLDSGNNNTQKRSQEEKKKGECCRATLSFSSLRNPFSCILTTVFQVVFQRNATGAPIRARFYTEVFIKTGKRRSYFYCCLWSYHTWTENWTADTGPKLLRGGLLLHDIVLHARVLHSIGHRQQQ